MYLLNSKHMLLAGSTNPTPRRPLSFRAQGCFKFGTLDSLYAQTVGPVTTAESRAAENKLLTKQQKPELKQAAFLMRPQSAHAKSAFFRSERQARLSLNCSRKPRSTRQGLHRLSELAICLHEGNAPEKPSAAGNALPPQPSTASCSKQDKQLRRHSNKETPLRRWKGVLS